MQALGNRAGWGGGGGGSFPGGSAVKNPPAIQEMQVQALGREDPLEESMATHLSIIVGIIPWTEEPGELQSMGLHKGWTQLND